MTSMTAWLPVLLVILCLISGRAEDGSQKEPRALDDNLLRAAGIFKAAQLTLRENVFALQQVFSDFNSMMVTMQTVSRSVSLTVQEMKSSLTHYATTANGNICARNLTLPTATVCAKEQDEMNLHREAFMSQLKYIWHTLQSSESLLSDIKSDDILVRDCWDIYKTGKRRNGMYRIWPKLWKYIGSFYVYCDMENHNGGWTVVHRRNSSENQGLFLKTWNDYMFGFGDLNDGFWLGNEKICVLSQQREYQLLVTLWNRVNVSVWAKYSVFHVAQKNQLFKLQIGGYSGTAGDILGPFNNCVFSTADSDHSKGKCAQVYSSGWWFNDCSSHGAGVAGQPSNDFNPFAWLPSNKPMLSVSRFEMKIKPML